MPKLKVNHWTKAEDRALLAATGSNRTMTDAAFAKQVGRTVSAVRQRRQRLLRPHLTVAAKRRQAARSDGSVHPDRQQWQRQYYERGSQNNHNSGQEWTEEEDRLLLQADRPDDTELSRQLGRTTKAIHARRYYLRKNFNRICQPRNRLPDLGEDLQAAA